MNQDLRTDTIALKNSFLKKLLLQLCNLISPLILYKREGKVLTFWV